MATNKSMFKFLAIVQLVQRVVECVQKKVHECKIKKARRKDELLQAKWERQIALAQGEVLEMERLARQRQLLARKAREAHNYSMREYEKYHGSKPRKLDDTGDTWPEEN